MNQVEFDCCPWLQEPESYELFASYAESIVAAGRADADLRFPALAAHLITCPDCLRSVEDTLDFLKKAVS